MNQSLASQLSHPQLNWDYITHPFEGDALQRRLLAEKMTTYLSRLKAGAVLAIDAPWGEGKSWFGRNWAKQLTLESYRVVYIDAFEQDYIEDPFLLIATELAQLIKEDQSVSDNFIQVSTAVMKAILPLAATSLINLIAIMTIGKMNVAQDIKEIIDEAQDISEEEIGEWIKDKFKGHEAEKQTVKKFRKELEKIAKADEKPIVIFIDELDRCRPDFAVKIIERIKHFFNVENVVFVLLLNREQLQNAVKGVYGAETDAATYLGKFVNFFFTLPKIESDDRYTSHIYKYTQKEAEKYHVVRNNFIEVFVPIAIFFKLSLRDVEKAVAMYVFAELYEHSNIYYLYVIYAICLKLKNPHLYNRIISNDIEAHQHLETALMRGHLALAKEWSELGTLSEWHKYMSAKLKREQINLHKLSETHPHLGNSMSPAGFIYLMDMFSTSAKKIDLSID